MYIFSKSMDVVLLVRSRVGLDADFRPRTVYSIVTKKASKNYPHSNKSISFVMTIAAVMESLFRYIRVSFSSR